MIQILQKFLLLYFTTLVASSLSRTKSIIFSFELHIIKAALSSAFSTLLYVAFGFMKKFVIFLKSSFLTNSVNAVPFPILKNTKVVS